MCFKNSANRTRSVMIKASWFSLIYSYMKKDLILDIEKWPWRPKQIISNYNNFLGFSKYSFLGKYYSRFTQPFLMKSRFSKYYNCFLRKIIKWNSSYTRSNLNHFLGFNSASVQVQKALKWANDSFFLESFLKKQSTQHVQSHL